MAGQPLPPSIASWPLLTPARCDKARGAKYWASKCSRPNSEIPIPFPNQFPTSVVRPYDYDCCPYRYSQEYQCARPTTQPQSQMGMNRLVQNGGEMDMELLMRMVQFKAKLSEFGLGTRGTGVFHAPQSLVQYNKANYNNIKEKRTKQGGDHGGSYQIRRNKNGTKGKNDDLVKVQKEKECHDPSLPPGIVLPMEWPY